MGNNGQGANGSNAGAQVSTSMHNDANRYRPLGFQELLEDDEEEDEDDDEDEEEDSDEA